MEQVFHDGWTAGGQFQTWRRHYSGDKNQWTNWVAEVNTNFLEFIGPVRCVRKSWDTQITIPWGGTRKEPHGFILINRDRLYAIWTAGNIGSRQTNLEQIWAKSSTAPTVTAIIDEANSIVTVTASDTCGLIYIGC